VRVVLDRERFPLPGWIFHAHEKKNQKTPDNPPNVSLCGPFWEALQQPQEMQLMVIQIVGEVPA